MPKQICLIARVCVRMQVNVCARGCARVCMCVRVCACAELVLPALYPEAGCHSVLFPFIKTNSGVCEKNVPLDVGGTTPSPAPHNFNVDQCRRRLCLAGKIRA